MCGIVGGTNPTWDYEKAVASLASRGPDSHHVVRLDSITLGFSRLAVIDVRPEADQPMKSADERLWITYNGEIYGFRRLRTELKALGVSFRTRSDTEVVLNAYLTWGDSFVDRIDGMFAIGLYDGRTETLKLWRDRVGIKPLYWFSDGKDFAYASELKAIEALCGVDTLSLDPTAVYDFLTYRYIPAPKSLYRQVFKLEPGSALQVDLKDRAKVKLRRYWALSDIPRRATPGSQAEVEAKLRALVNESVQDQRVADVPLGFFLSGGVDSSTVVSSAADKGGRLKTFSIGFGGTDTSETDCASLVAQRFETEHYERHFSHAMMRELFPRLREWYGEPFADLSAFPTYFVSRLAREEVTVALSGDGGDELFGGYRWYTQFAWLRFLARGNKLQRKSGMGRLRRRFRHGTLPRRILNLLDVLGDNEFGLYARLMGGMSPLEKLPWARILHIPDDYDDFWHFRRHWRADLPLITRLQHLDFNTFLPDCILTKVDRASMTNSLEVRVPLLGRRLVEFAFSLPEEMRLPGKIPKGVLRNSFKHNLPHEVLDLPKRGFSMPRAYGPVDSQAVQEVILDQLFDIRPEPKR